MRHLKPRLILRGDSASIVTDPHGKLPRSVLVSAAKILVWFVEEWFASLFCDRKNELLICDRYYHDILVDPKRYRFGGPVWAARFVGNLMPQPDLWVLLDAASEVLRSRKQEVTLEETQRQRYAYQSFIKEQRNSVVVNAAQPLDKVIDNVELAITDAVVRDAANRG